MQLTTYDRLFQIAEAQGGYFSTEQAKNTGCIRPCTSIVGSYPGGNGDWELVPCGASMVDFV